MPVRKSARLSARGRAECPPPEGADSEPNDQSIKALRSLFHTREGRRQNAFPPTARSRSNCPDTRPTPVRNRPSVTGTTPRNSKAWRALSVSPSCMTIMMRRGHFLSHYHPCEQHRAVPAPTAFGRARTSQQPTDATSRSRMLPRHSINAGHVRPTFPHRCEARLMRTGDDRANVGSQTVRSAVNPERDDSEFTAATPSRAPTR